MPNSLTYERLMVLVSLAGISILLVIFGLLQRSLIITNTAKEISDLRLAVVQNRPSAETFVQTPCFSVLVPFPIVNQKIKNYAGICVLEAKVLNPPVQLVIKSSRTQSQLNENSGVQMRLKNQKMYKNLETRYQGFDESYHFRTDDATTIFLRQGTDEFTVAFTSSGSQVSLDQSAITRLVDSILVIN